MAMTKTEYYAKQEIMDYLNDQGYPTYSGILNKFDVNLTKDPSVVAYTEPERARIVVNYHLRTDQVSTIIRHELLHNILRHLQRMEAKLGADIWSKTIPEIIEETFNIAGDYEISNRGYTEKDKQIARSIYLDGQTLQGLVTEDQHPDWVDLSLEEMYDKLMEERQAEMEKAKRELKKNRNLDTVKGYNDFVKEYNSGNISPEILAELKRLIKGEN